MLVEDARSIEGIFKIDEYFVVEESVIVLYLNLGVCRCT